MGGCAIAAKGREGGGSRGAKERAYVGGEGGIRRGIERGTDRRRYTACAAEKKRGE